MLRVLTGAIEARDPYTRGHSARVTALAEELARRLGWSEERLEGLRVGGWLHDIGKLGVSDEVLQKEGRLDDRELAQIREHPRLGVKLLLRTAALRQAIPYVLYHHERWDGTGYPSGKAGEEIPLEARVLAVADAFDAMTTNRPYRRALAESRAVEELERCAGSQFDPLVVDAFAAAWRDGELLLEPVAIAPGELAERLHAGALGVGDGAVRFREQLERAGAAVPADRSAAHRVSALYVCRLGAEGGEADRDALVPDYRREPDASPRSP
jgi:putative nucleotidyltransferase with HDIG domain